jgi:hypothetical protein
MPATSRTDVTVSEVRGRTVAIDSPASPWGATTRAGPVTAGFEPRGVRASDRRALRAPG